MNRWRISVMGRQGEVVEFYCAQGVTINVAASEAGVRLRTTCKGGSCGICSATLLGGQVDYVSPVSSDKLKSCPETTVFLCQATPTDNCRFEVQWLCSVIDKAPLSGRVAIKQQGKYGGS